MNDTKMKCLSVNWMMKCLRSLWLTAKNQKAFSYEYEKQGKNQQKLVNHFLMIIKKIRVDKYF